MDPNTGRLRSLSHDEDSLLSQMEKSQKDSALKELDGIGKKLEGLERVPEELRQEAKDLLAGREETYVDLKSNSGLAKWAQKRRSAKDKKKMRRKMVKNSKKKNRKK